QLKVRMKTISKPVVIRDQLFTYFVRRPATRKPIIESVENLPFDLKEGESKQIFVLVRDEDSSSEKGGIISPPRLNLVTTVHNETNALPYMSVFNFDDPFQDPNDPLLWRFTININTQNYKNVVDRDREVHFGLMAVSQFGVISDIGLHSFTILNRVKEPRITWPETGEFKHVMIKGQKNTFTFWAVDPLREGFTEAEILTNCSDLPGEAICQCKYIGNAFSSSREKGSFCSIYWAIPADYKESKADFKIRITNTNFLDKQDIQVVGYTRTLFLEEGPGFPKFPLPPIDDDNDETPEPPVQPEPNKPPGDQRGPVGFGSIQGDSL
ncbi:MAG: hypothetical protein KDD58_07965, partial [Bdellovibrionales bacterium]|nr:hypothetical protein [Bdellovibrionales bacterium]